ENSQFYNNIAGQGPAIWANDGADVMVINSIFEDNQATVDVDSAGGAISVFSRSKLTVKGSEFTNNKGFAGGAITTIFTPLTIEDSIFRNNESRSWGGAVNNDGASVPFQERYYDGDLPRDREGGETIIRNTVFDGNRSVGHGGGLALFGYDQDYVTIEDSTFINNEVIPNQEGTARGGGLRVAGFVTIKNTTVANNHSHEEGGGVWYQGEVPVTITNSTFSGNQAKDENGAGLGGGIFSGQWGSETNIINTTFANNYAGSEAGAIYATSQRHTLTNTIFYNNTAGNKTQIKQQTNRELIDGGNNLQYPDRVTDDPDDVNVTADIQIADPRLGDLQEIDGRLVHPLLEGSPAINAGTRKNAPKTDQRGLPRDDQYDIGAYEFAPTPVPSRGGDTPTDDSNSGEDNVSE
ncbi:MAG: choice-of-anchor Q domain-containing protein, partial [Coleofasciculus sp. C2-GNP5-27]